MLDNTGVEAVLRLIILDDYSRFIERETHPKLEHYVRILAAKVTDNNVRRVQVLDDALLDHTDVISFTNQSGNKARFLNRCNSIFNDGFHLDPMVSTATWLAGNGHDEPTSQGRLFAGSRVGLAVIQVCLLILQDLSFPQSSNTGGYEYMKWIIGVTIRPG